MSGYREVGKHTGEKDVVGKRAPPGEIKILSIFQKLPVALLLGFLPMRTACLCLPFAGELKDMITHDTYDTTFHLPH